MSKRQSRDYFQRRAEEERVAAENAIDERAAQSHRELADRYGSIANGSEHPPEDDADQSVMGIFLQDFRIVA